MAHETPHYLSEQLALAVEAAGGAFPHGTIWVLQQHAAGGDASDVWTRLFRDTDNAIREIVAEDEAVATEFADGDEVAVWDQWRPVQTSADGGLFWFDDDGGWRRLTPMALED